MVKTDLEFVILQHPQEKKKKLSSVPLIVETLENVTVKTGLSWPNLSKVLSPKENRKGIDPSRWAVLYLGTAKLSGKFNVNSNLPDLEGVVLLDGNWRQSKTLWWRNPWLLKLKRITLNPEAKSLYGNLRKEPRRACLSTLESVAEILLLVEKNQAAALELNEKFKIFLEQSSAL